jgi:hypothetical protein
MLNPTMRLTFCQICSAWMEIAISTPRLWTSLSMTMSDRRFDNQMLWVRTICDRSGMLPISVILERNYATKNAAKYSPIPTLVPYFSRIRDLTLTLSKRCCQDLSNLTTDSLPMLESCTLSFTYPQLSSGHITILENSLRLRRVSLSNIHFPTILRLPMLLVVLELNGSVTPADCLHVLRQCPNLEELSQLSLDSPCPGDQYPNEALVLSQLRTFRIRIDEGSDGELFFDHLALPSLNCIDMMFNTDAEWPQSSFLSLISRSECRPTELSLKCAEMPEEDFVDCLRALPSLIRCHVELVNFIGGWVLGELTITGDASNHLVPNLKTFHALELYECDDDSTIDNAFMDMVESRWSPSNSSCQSRGASRLARAHLSILCDTRSSPVDDGVNDWQERLRGQGLDVLVQ